MAIASSRSPVSDSHGDDHDVTRSVVGPQSASHLEAVDAGQHQVENDRVGPEAKRLLDRGRAVGRLEDHEPGRGEFGRVNLPRARRFLDDEHERPSRAYA